MPGYHSDFHSLLEINVNKVKNIFVIPHYHSDFHSLPEKLQTVKHITTEIFLINIREQHIWHNINFIIQYFLINIFTKTTFV